VVYRQLYGRERYERLESIKKTYDSANMFRLNHNVIPAELDTGRPGAAGHDQFVDHVRRPLSKHPAAKAPMILVRKRRTVVLIRRIVFVVQSGIHCDICICQSNKSPWRMIHATGGKLRTKVGTVLPLANAGEAHFMLQGVRIPPKGKIMLAVGPS
jgi:hypothetical protein